MIKAYVDKQHRNPQKMVEKPKSDGKVEMGALWTEPDPTATREASRRPIRSGLCQRSRWPLATAAPGMHVYMSCSLVLESKIRTDEPHEPEKLES